MGAQLDLDDLVADWPEAKAELTRLRAELDELRAMLEPTPDALELVVAISGVDPDHYIGGSTMHKRAVETMEENLELVAAYRARLLDEAAERGATWWIEQTSHIDPALAATNSGKWLIKLREKQTATLRAAIKGSHDLPRPGRKPRLSLPAQRGVSCVS